MCLPETQERALVPISSAHLALIQNPILGDIRKCGVETGVLFYAVVGELDRAGISRRILKYSDIYVNGQLIHWSVWKETEIYNGDAIAVVTIVRGGGGDSKNPFAVLFQVAAMVVGVWLTGGFGTAGLLGSGWFAAGSMSAQLLGAAFMLGASLLIGSLFPNQLSLGTTHEYKDDKVFAIQNTQNQARRYEAFPLVVGKMRMAPDFAAMPYTVLSGNDMYARYLYIVSAGDVQVSDARIGDTPISNYAGADVRVHKAWRGEQLTWFDLRIQEVSENVGLTQARGYVTRTTPLNTRKVVIMVVFPRGLVRVNQDGGREEQGVAFQVDYRPTGASAWSTVNSARTVNAARLSIGSTFGGYPNYIAVYLQDNNIPSLAQYSNEKFWGTRGSVIDYNDPRIIARISIEYSGGTSASVVAKYYSGNISLYEDGPDFIVYVGAGQTSNSASFSRVAKTTSQQRTGYTLTFPSTGQYDIRVRRTTPDVDTTITDYAIFNDSTLMGMQYHTADKSIKYRGRAYTLIELQLKASDELSGNVDTFNCLARSYGYVPNSSGGFTRQLTQNPAALALELMTNSDLNYRPIPWARIDQSAWRNFYNFCQKYGWQYNHVHNDGKPLGEVLVPLLAAGLGAISHNGASSYSVAWDEPDADYVDSATPRTCWGFEIRKEFPIQPIDGLRVEFINEDKNYQVDERTVYADGANDNNAKNVQRWNMPGVTNSGLVYKHARLRLAAMRLRPETIVYYTDWRSIDYKRGEKIMVSYDTYMVGSGQGVAVQQLMNEDGLCEGFMLDSFFEMSPENSYIARDASKKSVKTWRLQTIEGSNNVAYFEEPIPQEQAPIVGRVLSVGVSGRDSMEVTIQSIEHMENFSARITALPSAPDIMQAISGSIPAWDSQITSPSYYDRAKPNAPFLQMVRSDESVLIRLPGAGLVPRIAISYELVQKTGVTIEKVVAQIREVGAGEEWQSAGSVSGVEREIFINNVVQGRAYEVRLCAVSTFGVSSSWVELSTTVIGMATPPPDILLAYLEDERIKIVYDEPIDFAGFEVLMAYYHNAGVHQAISFSDGLFTTASIDISRNLEGERAFFIYAVDLAGNRSINPAVVRVQYEGARDTNVILTVDHRTLGFPGIKENCHIDDNGDLTADEVSYFWAENNSIFFEADDELFWRESRYAQMTYTLGFAVPDDAQGVSSHFLKRQIEGQMLSLDYNVGDYRLFWGNNSNLFWPGSDDALFWPTEWVPLPDYLPADFSYISIRIVLAGGITAGRIKQFVSEFDVPDVEEILIGYSLLAGWNTVILQKYFRNIKYADTIIYETEGLDPVTVNKRISGGQIELLPVDENNNPTQAIVNLVIRGY